MKRYMSPIILVLSLIGLNACTLPKAIETYDAKECVEIRKLAQEQFLSRAPLKDARLNNDNGNVRAILGRSSQDSDDSEGQARRISYNRRCQ